MVHPTRLEAAGSFRSCIVIDVVKKGSMMKKPLAKPRTRGSNRPVATPLGPIEQVPTELLRPYERGSRLHNDRQLFKIMGSLETFGWVNPILAEMNGTIIAGAGRLEAAKRLGFTAVPVIRIEHLTPDQVRAYRIADNRLAELSEWDDETLAIELQHLSTADLDFNIEVIGFDHGEIDMRIDPVAAGDQATDPADQDVPGPTETAICQLGDVWICGDHRLLCDSSLEASSFDTVMAGAKAVMSFQDAPYNCEINGHVSGLGKVKHREFAMASGEMSADGFRSFLGNNLALVTHHLTDGAILALMMDWRNLSTLEAAALGAGLKPINLAVWAKTAGGMGSLYRSQHELALIVKKGDAPHINNVQLGKFKRYRTNVWRYPGVNSFGRGRMEQLAAHPTCKPIPLVADIIRDVSNRGDIVLDSFMGSGTTLLAAERTGRIAYGMDIDPLYIDVTIRRWEKMTNRQAVLESTGETFSAVAARRAEQASLSAGG
jgi:DNA modification methylase